MSKPRDVNSNDCWNKGMTKWPVITNEIQLRVSSRREGHICPYRWEFALSLWLLGNFLKIDYSVVCFLKPLKVDCLLLVMMDWEANRLDFRPRRLAWVQPVCISINAVSALKGLKRTTDRETFADENPASHSDPKMFDTRSTFQPLFNRFRVKFQAIVYACTDYRTSSKLWIKYIYPDI